MLGGLVERVTGALRALRVVPVGGRYGVLAGVVILIGAMVFMSQNSTVALPFSRTAGWAAPGVVDTRVPLQEVPVRPVRRDANAPEEPGARLDLAGLRSFVIGIDLDYLDETAMSYQLILKDFVDQVVWSEEIPEAFVSDGRALVKLNTRRFDEGIHQIVVEAHESDGSTTLVSQGTFEIYR